MKSRIVCGSLYDAVSAPKLRNFDAIVIGAMKWVEIVQGSSNMTGTDLYVNTPHCAAAVRPWVIEVTTSTLPPARVRTCSVLSGSC